MVYVTLDVFLKMPETYIRLAESGTNVYVQLGGGAAIKLEKHENTVEGERNAISSLQRRIW